MVKVLVIAPPDMWGFGKKKHSNNIQYLVTNGIGVILNSKNHSKWILSDAGYYYGLLNFTAESMKNKVEIVSYCDTFQKVRAKIPQWMTETKEELLDFSIDELKKFNSSIHSVNLGATNVNILAILRRALTKILKCNPSIEKIETSLLNYEDVRLELSSIIDELFPITSFETLDVYWEEINKSINILNELASCGNDIWIAQQTQDTDDKVFQEYNSLHAKFVSSIQTIISISETQSDNFFVQQKIEGLNKELEVNLVNYKDENSD